MANPFDQFDVVLTLGVRKNPFDGLSDASQPKTPAPPVDGAGGPSTFEDVLKTVPSAGARGVAGLAGLPGSLRAISQGAANRYIIDPILSLATGEPAEEIQKKADTVQAQRPGWSRVIDNLAATGIEKGMDTASEAVAGAPLYKPQTVPGQYVGTITEMGVSSLPFLAGGLFAKAAQFVAPGLLSEAAGRAARGSEYEGAARAAGGVVGGIGSAVASVPRGARPLMQEAIQGAGFTEVELQAAYQMMEDAAKLPGGGVRLTLDEALNNVTGGRAQRLSQVRRVAEHSGEQGGQPLIDVSAARPGEVRGAGNAVIDGMAGQALDPIETGILAQKAAKGTISDIQESINQATRPGYKAIEGVRLDPQEFQSLAADPIFASTLKEIRGTPALNRTIANLPDDAVGTVDLVQRRMREAAENAAMPGQASTSNLAAANLESARTPAIAAADAATQGRYGQVRDAQSQLRATYLDPTVRGPTGAIAARENVMEQARALLPNQPTAGMDAAVSQTVRQITSKDPAAAENLVRIYAQTIFDEATQAMQGGQNVYGGAKFSALIAGNPQQARNLEASVRALPNGNARWEGFRRLLDVMEATGYRPQKGSDTAFNLAIQGRLREGSLPGAIAEGAPGSAIGAAITGPVGTVTGGVAAVRRALGERLDRYRLGQNVSDLAWMLTDPKAAPLLKELSKAPAGSAKSQGIALRLTYLAERGVNSSNLSSGPINQ